MNDKFEWSRLVEFYETDLAGMVCLGLWRLQVAALLVDDDIDADHQDVQSV